MTDAIVIDPKGYKVEYVLVDDNSNPIGYSLQEGETLIYDAWLTALRMVKPRYLKDGWHETATAEEIEAAKPMQPPPVHHEPTETEIITMLALTGIYEQGNAEQMVAIYVSLVKLGYKTVDDVPDNIRDAVSLIVDSKFSR